MKKESELMDFVRSIPADIQNTHALNLNVRSYAGYANANFHGHKVQLFYWFFESQEFHSSLSRNMKEIAKTPLIIWLNGGPGSSSTLGLFLENGPYKIADTPIGELVENEYSWNKNAHIMYWDQPIGTGYSTVENENPETTYAQNEDDLSEMFYMALQDFYSNHPEYRSCPLYITGESYGGKYIPNIALKIHDRNLQQSNNENLINLKGVSVGDGWINASMQVKVYIDYAYTLGYIDTLQREQSMADYELFMIALENGDWNAAYSISNNIISNISSQGGGFNVYDIRTRKDLSKGNVQEYMELPAVKKALHVPIEQKWNCADNAGPVAVNLTEDNMRDSSKLYSDLISLEDLYKVMMYTATFDTACGALSTEILLLGLNKWNNPEDNARWKALARNIWAQPSNNVKGFIKQYKNLTQIVLPNSGHEVPYYLPEISRDMIYKWINNESFPIYSPSTVKL